MKLIFYKIIEDAAGRPVVRRVMTVEAGVLGSASPGQMIPAGHLRLAHWRDFADLFEIV